MAYAPEGSIADTAFNEGLAMFFRDFATFAEFVGKKNTAQAEAATKADYYEVEEDPYYVYFSVPGTVESWRLAAGDPGLQRYYAPIDNTETYMARVQTKWHQEAPYNNQVPLIDYRNGNKTGRVGCFAVAFGQVMANHQRPTFYNWALLTVAPTISTSNSSAASEVSRLLYNIANRFTFFELTSTGTRGHTPLGNIVPGIQAQGYTVTETSYSGPVSSAAIYGEIRDNHRPLLMSGQDLKFAPNGQEIWSGHIWVIEGILKKERWYYWRSTVIEGTSYSLQSRERVRAQMILCNWGWGGLSDGWYYNFGPVYTDGKTYSFTYDKFLYTNIKPN